MGSTGTELQKKNRIKNELKHVNNEEWLWSWRLSRWYVLDDVSEWAIIDKTFVCPVWDSYHYRHYTVAAVANVVVVVTAEALQYWDTSTNQCNIVSTTWALKLGISVGYDDNADAAVVVATDNANDHGSNVTGRSFSWFRSVGAVFSGAIAAAYDFTVVIVVVFHWSKYYCYCCWGYCLCDYPCSRHAFSDVNLIPPGPCCRIAVIVGACRNRQLIGYNRQHQRCHYFYTFYTVYFRDWDDINSSITQIVAAAATTATMVWIGRADFEWLFRERDAILLTVLPRKQQAQVTN